MFVFVSHLTVPEEDREVLEGHFRDRARLVDRFPGFLYLQILRPEAGESSFAFLTAWRDRAAFRSYMRSREHAASRAREPLEVMQRAQVRHQAYEVLMDSRQETEWTS